MQLATDLSPVMAGLALRRGACPTLGQPMETGDGLLVRFRPRDGSLSPSAAAEIARAARRFGNGMLEVTARGNLQVRGVREHTAADLEAAVLAATDVETGLSILVPPLAGIDPAEVADPRPLANALRKAADRAGLIACLHPKTSVVVDAGGALSLDHLAADLRITATSDGWSVRAGNGPSTAPLSGEQAIAAAVALLKRLGDATDRIPPVAMSVPPPTLVGVHALGGERLALGLAPTFGALAADSFEHLTIEAERAGCTELRLGGRALLVVGLSPSAAAQFTSRAAALGLVADPRDPRLAIAACPGSEGCASGQIPARRIAADLAAAAPGLLDGSTTLHVSGCTKGCAHPRPADLAIVGMGQGVSIVRSGRAGDPALATARPEALAPGLAQLAGLYRQSRHAQETASHWLARLDPETIAAALA